ncbi:MAG: ABC transporter ATP-binding protein [Pseudomonadota bacterium]
MTKLDVQDITVKVGATPLVKQASFTLQPGELVALVGPNGAGKTSLLRASLGLEPVSTGISQVNGRDVTALSPSARAKAIAYLPQQRPLAWPSRVRDIALLGRFAYGASPGRITARDQTAVSAAMEKADIGHLADRRADTLSGGELARVHIARALAAQAPILIADEPTAALDPRHQLRVMDVIKAYVSDGGAVLVVLHDIILAAHYASRIIWMQSGKIVADGPPRETLTTDRMADVFGVKAAVSGGTLRVLEAL